MKVVLYPVNDQTWAQFSSWHKARELRIPPMTSDAILVGVDSGDLIIGCCLYPTMGPFCVVEYACSNPLAKARLVHLGALVLVHHIQVYGALRGKNMLCFPRDKSVARILRKAGATESPAELLYFPPGADTGVAIQATGGL